MFFSILLWSKKCQAWKNEYNCFKVMSFKWDIFLNKTLSRFLFLLTLKGQKLTISNTLGYLNTKVLAFKANDKIMRQSSHCIQHLLKLRHCTEIKWIQIPNFNNLYFVFLEGVQMPYADSEICPTTGSPWISIRKTDKQKWEGVQIFQAWDCLSKKHWILLHPLGH